MDARNLDFKTMKQKYAKYKDNIGKEEQAEDQE